RGDAAACPADGGALRLPGTESHARVAQTYVLVPQGLLRGRGSTPPIGAGEQPRRTRRAPGRTGPFRAVPGRGRRRPTGARRDAEEAARARGVAGLAHAGRELARDAAGGRVLGLRRLISSGCSGAVAPEGLIQQGSS